MYDAITLSLYGRTKHSDLIAVVNRFTASAPLNEKGDKVANSEFLHLYGQMQIIQNVSLGRFYIGFIFLTFNKKFTCHRNLYAKNRYRCNLLYDCGDTAAL